MIPNITIRNRADLEKEIEDMEKDKDYELDEEEEVAGSGRKGLNMGAHMLAKENGKVSEKDSSKTVKDEAPTNDDKLTSVIPEGEKEKDKTASSTVTVHGNVNKNEIKENGKNEEQDMVEESSKTEDASKDADAAKRIRKTDYKIKLQKIRRLGK